MTRLVALSPACALTDVITEFGPRSVPIINPVTGNEHRARIDLPNGFEYLIAEIGSASGKSTAGVAMELSESYAQFCELHLNGSGIIDRAAA